jgi:AraC-like DNA-binding protein
LNFSDILLIIVSSAGLLHGMLVGFYLIIFKKKKSLTNTILGFILVFMALRIGKSVLLNFGDNLELSFIVAGLAFLLLIGPLLRWYVMGMTRPNFKLPKYYLFELLPFTLIFVSSFLVSEEMIVKESKQTIIVFGSVLIFIYLHFAFYIFSSGIVLKRAKKSYKDTLQTKSQKAIFEWLQLVIIGFIINWVSYFLNIIEDTVPYIVGPLLYSLVIYFLSYKAFQLKVTELDGDAFKKNENVGLFDDIKKHVIGDKLYLESDISLSRVSKLVGKSAQNTSEIINQYAKQNFNDFINYYRIQEAKKMLLDSKNEKYTISSIAFDIGFNSLSSFNTAFKKFEGTTPSLFRKN